MGGEARTLDRSQYRALARQRVDDLKQILETQPASVGVKSAIELCVHLARAIDAFHMEAIRFRMFTLARLFGSGTVEVPDLAHETLREIQHALEAAGFQTRSIAH